MYSTGPKSMQYVVFLFILCSAVPAFVQMVGFRFQVENGQREGVMAGTQIAGDFVVGGWDGPAGTCFAIRVT